MNTLQYGQALLGSGDLTWRRNGRKHRDSLKANYFMSWPATSNVFDTRCSEEEITLVSGKKPYSKSPLHFAWRVAFNLREIDNKTDLLEIISETTYKEIGFEDAMSIVRKASQRWWATHNHLLPTEGRAYLIWNDGLDTYLVLEDNDNYLAWNWSSSA